MTSNTNNASLTECTINRLKPKGSEIYIENKSYSSSVKTRTIIIKVYYTSMPQGIIIKGSKFDIERIVFNTITSISNYSQIIANRVKILSPKFTMGIKIQLKIEPDAKVSERNFRTELERIERLTVDPVHSKSTLHISFSIHRIRIKLIELAYLRKDGGYS